MKPVLQVALDFLNLKVDLDLDGISLRQLLEAGDGKHKSLERTLYSESWAYQGKTTFFGSADNQLEGAFLAEACARKGGIKYVWRNKKVGKDGLYDYIKDPFEKNDIALDEKGLKLKNQLLNYMLDYQIEKMTRELKPEKIRL